MTTSDLPAEGQPDVSTEGTEAPFDDVITLSTSTDDDGAVTVTVVGEVDTFTAPVLANGRLYCRSYAGEVVCLDLTKAR